MAETLPLSMLFFGVSIVGKRPNEITEIKSKMGDNGCVSCWNFNQKFIVEWFASIYVVDVTTIYIIHQFETFTRKLFNGTSNTEILFCIILLIHPHLALYGFWCWLCGFEVCTGTKALNQIFVNSVQVANLC